MSRWSLRLASFALAGILAAPFAARAGEVYSYVDSDGVIHFSNAPSDRRYHKVKRAGEAGGVYRSTNGGPLRQVRARSGFGGGSAGASANATPVGSTSARYVEHVKAAAAKYNLPEALLFAVMAVESNFNPDAVSNKGATGLMQLMPGTARDMYVGDVYDPVDNIEGGARYLRILANQYRGDMVKTLAAYNAGPEAVRRAGGDVPDIPETRAYVRKVVSLYNAYKAGR